MSIFRKNWLLRYGKQEVAKVLRTNQILLQAANALAIPVIHTEQYPKGLGHTHPEIKMYLGNRQPLEKTCFSSCGATGFADASDGQSRQQYILTGMEAHICVMQTALELISQGRQVFVVQDGICSRDKTNFKNALHRLRQAGVIITNRESVLFEWLRDASHEQFRALSKLIR